MDPLTAIGLASNVISLVGAAYEAASVCYEIYELGASTEVSRITEIAEQLQRCYGSLESSLDTSIKQDDLVILSARCRRTASQLAGELAALQGGKSSWRTTVTKFVRMKRKAAQIKKLEKALDEYQRMINARILVDLRHWIQTLRQEEDNRYTDLMQKLASLEATSTLDQTTAATGLKELIDEAIMGNTGEHIRTRQYMDQALKFAALSPAKTQLSTEEKHRVLESLYFEDMDLRYNEVASQYPETFEWIFRDFKDRRWDRFDTWLAEGNKIYWISGSPGSGKSTLMKFIVSDQRTYDALNRRSGENPCLVLQIYFWLSGSKMQRSMKGFLCTLLYQLLDRVQLNEGISAQIDSKIKAKKTYKDWSVADLRTLTQNLLGIVSKDQKSCIFIDGIDELDQDEDKGQLLDFLESMTHTRSLKLCISSRPEFQLQRRLSSYPKLRLQDLTRADIKKFLDTELAAMFLRERGNIPDKPIFEGLVEAMLKKADGVFLWVQYAIKGVRQGITNQEDSQSLEDRLNDLPSGMEQLYANMWQRLNGDQKRYHEDASMYFQYILDEYSTISLFDLMLATRPALREEYFTHLTKLDSRSMRDQLRVFQTIIETRCAGLLQCSFPDIIKAPSSYLSRSASLDHLVGRHDIVWERSSFHEETIIEDSDELYLGRRLKWYQKSHVSFFHRTARDFLQDTATGRAIAGCYTISPQQITENLCEAELCLWLQDPRIKAVNDYSQLMMSISSRLDTDRAVSLLQKQEKVCEAIIPRLTLDDENPYGRTKDVLLALASTDTRFDILESLIKLLRKDASSYYFGCMVGEVMYSFEDPDESLDSLKYLLQKNPDLRHRNRASVAKLIQTPLETVIASVINDSLRRWQIYLDFESRGERTDSHDSLNESRNALAQEILSVIEGGDVFLINVDVNNTFGGGMLKLWLEIGAHWFFQHLPKFFAKRPSDRVELKDLLPPVDADITTNALAFWCSDVRHIYAGDLGFYWLVPPGEITRVGKVCLEKLAAFPEKPEVLESQQELISELKAIRPQCQVVDAHDWEQSMDRRSKEVPRGHRFMPWKTINGTNWRWEGWSLQPPPANPTLRYGMLAESCREKPGRPFSCPEFPLHAGEGYFDWDLFGDG